MCRPRFAGDTKMHCSKVLRASVHYKSRLAFLYQNMWNHKGTSKIYFCTDSMLKDINEQFSCAPFPRQETGKVVWVLSLDHLRIRIFRPFTDSDQHSFQIFFCHIGHKIKTVILLYKKMKVIEICKKAIEILNRPLFLMSIIINIITTTVVKI